MFPAIVAAIGLGAQAVGFLGASDAASKEARAQAKAGKKIQKITDQQNKIYQQQARLAAEAAKQTASIQTASATQANAIRTDIVNRTNAIRQDIAGAQNQQADASAAAEGARFAQMTLDTTRRRRDIIRNAIYARGSALAGAVASGAQGGSGIQGGFAQIRTEEGQQLLGEFQNFAVGDTIFQANKAYTDAGSLVNQYQADLASLQSEGEAQLANLQASTEARLARSSAGFADRNAKLTQQVYALQNQTDRVQSKANVQIGNARTNQYTYGGVSSLGSSLQSVGMSLFNT